jgi:hypothetical protein
MTVVCREANVVLVSFNARPPEVVCETCPFQRCCACANWDRDRRVCLARGTDGPPATAPEDWCGEWQPRPLQLVAAARDREASTG